MTEAGATSTPTTGAGPDAPGGAATGRQVTAGTSGRPIWSTFAGLAGLILAVDQLTKAWLTSFLAPGQSVDVAGDLIRLVHGQNAGGLFGMFQGQALPFALISLVVVGLIVGYHARSGRDPYLSITLGLLLGGALGNLLDRVRLGYVVDFVDAGIGSLRWYTFNVADAAISFAILLLLAASIWPSVARRAGTGGRG
ncbi:MAG TPA: signal peptidase II [Patescibacteria group bacterium]|nr:signal peptidase II [Patescibacteria group bacterium]